MADAFIGEIRIFGFDFVPKGWAQCNGQLLPLFQNTALFSILGTTYGGDGRTTFALPDLQGRVPMCAGAGAGLSFRDLGETTGVDSVTLLSSQMPQHNHVFNVTSANATQVSSANAQLARGFRGNLQSNNAIRTYSAAAPNQPMFPQAIGNQGGGQPHTNMMPFLSFNFCIATVGIFPPRP